MNAFVANPATNIEKSKSFQIGLPIIIGIGIAIGSVMSNYNQYKDIPGLPPSYVFPLVWSAIYFIFAMCMVAVIQSENKGLNFFGQKFDILLPRRAYKYTIFVVIVLFFALVLLAMIKSSSITTLQKKAGGFLSIGLLSFAGLILCNGDVSNPDDNDLEVNGKVYLMLLFFVNGMINGAWSILFTNFGPNNFISQYFSLVGIFILINLVIVKMFFGFDYELDLDRTSNPAPTYISYVFLIVYLLALGATFYVKNGMYSRIGLGIAIALVICLEGVIIGIQPKISITYNKIVYAVWGCLASCFCAKQINKKIDVGPATELMTETDNGTKMGRMLNNTSVRS